MELYLEGQGHVISRKKVQRFMRAMGIEGLAPGPRTSVPKKGHKVSEPTARDRDHEAEPSLACDITYVPMPSGYLYLTAVMDWFSRHVLSWRLSNSMDVEFCMEPLEEALSHGRPEIFKHGSRLSSRARSSRVGTQGVDPDQHGWQRPRDRQRDGRAVCGER